MTVEPHEQAIEGFALSRQQTRLWPLQKDNAAFRSDCLVLIEGALDVTRVERSLRGACERHEILRTRFPHLPGMAYPLQAIGDVESMIERIPAPDEMLRAEADLHSAAERLLEVSRIAGFDFENGPLMRWALCPVSKSRHLLLVSAPALCLDARSLGVLLEAVADGYGRAPGEPTAEEAPVQYSQFAEWQQQFLHSESSREGRTYWESEGRLRYAPLKLPTEKPWDEGSAFAPAVSRFRLDPEISASVETASARCRVSTRTFLQACWHALLWRLSEQSELVVGTLVEGRDHEELADAVGLYARHVPVGFHFERETKFGDLLAHLEASVEQATRWQQTFEAEALAAGSPGASGWPTPPATFEYSAWPESRTSAQATFSLLLLDSVIDQSKLRLSFGQSQDGLRGRLAYDARCFDADAVEVIRECLEQAVRSAAAQPEVRVAELGIVPEAQRHKLLVRYNRTHFEFPAQRCLHELVEQQVESTPERVAIEFEDHRLTYAELESRSNRLAHHLQALGVGPESLVAIDLERCVEMVVAVLGILKAGGAFVPMAPSYSKSRAKYVLEDSAAQVVITDAPTIGKLPEHSCAVVRVDADWPDIAKHGDARPRSGVNPDNLAYLIYTSGSTGEPKGVEVEHRSVVNYLSCVDRILMDECLECIPFVTRLTFDAALKQFFVPLLRGATVRMMSDAQARDPEALLRVVGAHARSGLNCVPSLWASMLGLLESEFGPEVPTSLEWLYLGGEKVSTDLLERSWRMLPNLRIWNVYGPTEATANACVGELFDSGEAAIGRPLGNLTVYVLDEESQPVPDGYTGELHIGGIGVARGYRHRPELTAEKFVLDPFSDVSGGRLYKTGDRVRYLPDGRLQYLGRMDFQVKVRGYRVEPGEIEAVLMRHATVLEAVVTSRESATGVTQLVAYVTPSEEQAPNAPALRGFLDELLPDYMVPAHFVLLGELPLDGHGKVDRKALPAPSTADSEAGRPYVAPRNAVEEMLADIWAEVLERERVGIHDRFLELGGHSLLATQLVVRVRDVFHVDMPIGELFKSDSVAALAESLLAHEAVPGRTEKIASALLKVRSMSSEEVRRTLQKKRSAVSGPAVSRH